MTTIPTLPNLTILPSGEVVYKGKTLKPITLTITMIRESIKPKK